MSIDQEVLHSLYGLSLILSFYQHFQYRQYGFNYIVLCLKFSKKVRWTKQSCLLIKIFLKDKLNWNVLCSTQHFLKRQYQLYWLFNKRIWTVLSFQQNFQQRLYGLNYFVFSSKFSKKTIWIERYYLFIKIFVKGNMV